MWRRKETGMEAHVRSFNCCRGLWATASWGPGTSLGYQMGMNMGGFVLQAPAPHTSGFLAST